MLVGLRPDHHLERFTIVHVSVAVRHAVEVNDTIEDTSRMDAPFQNVGKQFANVGAHRSRAAAYHDVVIESGLGAGHGCILRHADTANGSTRAGDLNRRFGRLSEAHAFRALRGHRTPGELSYALDRLGTTFAHHIGGAKLAAKRTAVGMATEENDAFRTQALRRNDAAEGDRPVTHDGDDLAGADLGNNRRVVAGPHDVG